MNIDEDAQARALISEIERKAKLLRRLQEEKLTVRAEATPHLREVLAARIDNVAMELSLMASNRIFRPQLPRNH